MTHEETAIIERIAMAKRALKRGFMSSEEVDTLNWALDHVNIYNNPLPTVDLIVTFPVKVGDEYEEHIVLVNRRNPPLGWALPGGYQNNGETLEQAAVREGEEEFGQRAEIVRQFRTYSDPKRDPRKHTNTTVFIARLNITQVPRAGDDAKEVTIVPRDKAILLTRGTLGHDQILYDYYY